MFNFFSKEDKQLYNMLGHLNMAEKEISLKDNSETEIYEVACPDDEYAFSKCIHWLIAFISIASGTF